jgi:hypothetical protein
MNERTLNLLPNGSLGSFSEIVAITPQDMIDDYERLYVGSNCLGSGPIN